MDAISYLDRRSKLQNYFDRTANDAWAKLTSDAPVSGIRATAVSYTHLTLPTKRIV